MENLLFYHFQSDEQPLSLMQLLQLDEQQQSLIQLMQPDEQSLNSTARQTAAVTMKPAVCVQT
jgi:predicted ribonuclease toxin of YeeF-YezG toxin-antitoxin module